MTSSFIENIMHASPSAWFGACFIFGYFIFMIYLIAFRIKKGEHLDHH